MNTRLSVIACIALALTKPAFASQVEQAEIQAFLPAGKTLITASQKELLWATNQAMIADPCDPAGMVASALEPLTTGGPVRADRSFLAAYLVGNATFVVGGKAANPATVASIVTAVASVNQGTAGALSAAAIAKVMATAIIIAPQSAWNVGCAAGPGVEAGSTYAVVRQLEHVPAAAVGLFAQGEASAALSDAEKISIAVEAIKGSPARASVIAEQVSMLMTSDVEDVTFMKGVISGVPSAVAGIAAGVAAGNPMLSATLATIAMTMNDATRATMPKIAEAMAAIAPAEKIGDMAFSVGQMMAGAPDGGTACAEAGKMSAVFASAIAAKKLPAAETASQLAAMASSLALGLESWVVPDPTTDAQKAQNVAVAKAAAEIAENAVKYDPVFARDVVGSVGEVFSGLPADVLDAILARIQTAGVLAAGPKNAWTVIFAISLIRTMPSCASFPIGPINGDETASQNL